MTDLTLAQQIQVAETNIARVLGCTSVPTLMHEVKEYASLRWQDGYDRGYEDGCDD